MIAPLRFLLDSFCERREEWSDFDAEMYAQLCVLERSILIESGGYRTPASRHAVLASWRTRSQGGLPEFTSTRISRSA